jgi:uncharacterized protein YbaR (Trm112 family)
MKYRLMDLLACPICKKFPVVLYEFYIERHPGERGRKAYPLCEVYCGYKKIYVRDLKSPPCEECTELEIESGILYCEKCGRWYPIEEEIPHMLPDDLRDVKEDLSFLKKYKDKIPEKILYEGKPVNLRQGPPEQSS